ncbi:putative membrane protein DUF2061 [Hoeflea marina]|uniref:Putative membrane protein DUF2061 n=1 Tax=Hoeflea marina TaxID=274592 RepID=A0A317PFB3_9HYPH|nr:DUF2061 domain-containing protein [Hoeflea marina]PWV98340.1 putative membrane protein DUF2061 [Hoeflea marina]
METRTRTIAKATSWQLSGLVSMSGLAWLQSGSIAGAFSFALSAAAIGFVCFFLHERIWARIAWGRPGDRGAGGPGGPGLTDAHLTEIR